MTAVPRSARRRAAPVRQQAHAHKTDPVSDWCAHAVRGLGVTLERMRIDCQLDEALAGGGVRHLGADCRALLAGELKGTAARDRRLPQRYRLARTGRAAPGRVAEPTYWRS
jgi:hypothetical protein